MWRNRTPDDSGTIVLGWLTKLAVTLGLLGFLAYDGVALVTATFSVADRANTYANDAASDYRTTKDINKTYEQVAAEAMSNDDTVDLRSFSIDTDGTAHVTARHTATTLWMDRVGFMKKWTHVSGKGEGASFS